MAINVREMERDQLWLMPPSVRDWLPGGHLAWFVLDVVAELDVSEFYAPYRGDGRGGAVYDPALMLAVLIYAYCVGEHSSRRIEGRLVDDVAFRVVAANQHPDHATLARFRARHQEAIAALFAQVLGLCVAEGLVAAGVVAIDGTKIEANASAWSNRTRRQIAEEVLAEAARTDAAEDAEFGDRRGGELPERWADTRDRRARLREALRQLDAAGASDAETYEAARRAKEAALGRKLPGRKPSPNSKKTKDRLANTTDPDSRMLRARNRFVQGFNAQAAVSEDQVVVAAELTNAANDSTMFAPLVEATETNLEQAGSDAVGTFVADAGYWSVPNATLATDAELLITPSRPHTASPTPTTRASPSAPPCSTASTPASSPCVKPPRRWACPKCGPASSEKIAGPVASTPLGSARPCSTGSPPTRGAPATPNARSPPSRCPATSRPTSASGASRGARCRLR